jgi:hypothetical protein
MVDPDSTKDLQLAISREISSLIHLVDAASRYSTMSLLTLRDVNDQFLHHAERLVLRCRELDVQLERDLRASG